MYKKLFVLILSFICLFQCSNQTKPQVFSYPFENIYGLPDEIVNDLRLHAFHFCVDICTANKDVIFRKNTTISNIDSICKLASIGIPYKLYRPREDSLDCGKPAEYYYYLNSYTWIVPVVIDSLTVVEIAYNRGIKESKKHPIRCYTNSKTWTMCMIHIEISRYYILKYFYNKYKTIPVFIGSIHFGYQYLFTIPGHEKEIFGRIKFSDNIQELRLKCTNPENPCIVLSSVNSQRIKDSRPYKSIVSLPEAYKDYSIKIKNQNKHNMEQLSTNH